MQKKKKATKKQQTRLKKEVSNKKADLDRLKTNEGKNEKQSESAPAGHVEIEKPPSVLGPPIGRVVGLNNLGNTCYFNSLTQVLLCSPSIAEEFLPKGTRGPLGQGLHEVVQACYGPEAGAARDATASKQQKAKSATFTPQRLHSSILKVAPQFKGGGQQDSHECMRLLLDGLHNEEKKLKKSRSSDPHQEAPKSASVEKTFIDQVFGAKFASNLQCQSCKKTTTSLEDFLDISVQLPGGRDGQDFMTNRGQSKAAPYKKGKKANVEVPTSDNGLSIKQQKKQAKQEQQKLKAAKKRERQKDRSRNPKDASQESAFAPDPAPSQYSTAATTPPPGLSPEPLAVDIRKEGKTEALSESNPGTDAGCFHSVQEDAESNASDRTSEANLGRLANGFHDSQCNGVHTASSGVPLTSSSHSDVSPRAEEHANGNFQPSPETQMDGSGESEHAALRNAETGLDCPDTGERDSAEQPEGQASAESQSFRSAGEGVDNIAQADLASDPSASQAVPPQANTSVEFSQEEAKSKIEADYQEAWEPASSTPEDPQGGKEATIQACLAAFFAPETVDWSCPAERVDAEDSDSSSSKYLTPKPTHSRSMKRNVSFSEEKPEVRLIPGSSEQRGTDIREALRGRSCFCRPLRVDDASVLVTAERQILARRTQIMLGVQPLDDKPATLNLVSDPMHIVNVDTESMQDSDDEEEQQTVTATAQLLMDCVADLIAHEGVEGALAMVDSGMDLYPMHKPTSVRGKLPSDTEGGAWEYPLRSSPSLEQTDFASRDSYLSCVSPKSDLGTNMPLESAGPSGETEPASLTSFDSIGLDSPIKHSGSSGSAGNDLQTVDEHPGGVGSNGPQSMASPGHETADDEQAEEPNRSEVNVGLTDPPAVEIPSPGSFSQTDESPSPSAPQSEFFSVDSKIETTQDSQLGSVPSSPYSKGVPPVANGYHSSLRVKKQPLRLQKAQKAYAVFRPPKLLAVHLKRFEILASGKTKKLRQIIHFDSELDLSPYCQLSADSQKACTKYDLLGVVVHEGPSLQSGHYWAYVRRCVSKPAENPSKTSASLPDVVEGSESPEAPSDQELPPALLNGLQQGAAADESAAVVDGGQAACQLDPPGTEGDGEHRRSLASEFATASMKARDCVWYKVSDSHVSKASLDDVLQSEAYILLYQQQDA